MKGKMILVPFPFTDLTTAKLRPALVIYEGKKDVVIAFVSSKAPSAISDVDVLITKKQAGFSKTGLKLDSVIKLDKIATMLKDLIVGELDKDLRQEVNRKLRKIMEI
ncbi:MAG: type II toxin-antitoxin system PemK/MazF family toxin [Dehalococcoidia bacterium]|nr:type II toxin-antitoxin system PemK/MazF family toxin [Dehalococcoidia bacterium]